MSRPSYVNTGPGAAAGPLRYEPAFEHLEPHEEQTDAALTETVDRIQRIVHRDSGHAERGVHAKSHGILRGELTVHDDLPAVFAQGVFSAPRTYPVVMRFSTIPGDILDDSISTPRGLAIKIVGVDGERLPGSERDVTQDFVLVNGPVFVKPSAKSFLASLKQLAATTDKAPGLKKVISAVMRGAVVDFFRTRGGEWEVQVQLCTDLATMPIEDASVRWPEDTSPYVTVAQLNVSAQSAWTPQRAAVVDESMSFSPWHGLAAHRPLGSINRARRLAYERARRFRADNNGVIIEEPRTLDELR